ncbi:MAP1B protein, partial [Uria aalge]|nr:MAP1B protein [Uria aalge]
GIRSWDTNLIECNLDEELKLFVSRHSARFSPEVRGQKILHHRSDILETVVLINPSDEAVSTEVRLMITDAARHKLLVLTGQCFENTGELILQSGSFSFQNFIEIFTDQEIGELLSTTHPANKASLTLFCPEEGDWKNSNLDRHNLQDFINIKLNSASILPEMEGLSEFTEYLSESVEVPSPFDILEPPTSGGFLKLSKPCCYIFPGGRGDSALFAVNGFNMLINGGSERKSCFWKLIRHLDRMQYFMQQWSGTNKDKAEFLLPNGQELDIPLSYFTSVSSLIVWHPANPAEKIIRVLFPGNSTQYNILEGLEKLKHLDFLKQPVVTQKDLTGNVASPAVKQAKLKQRTDSKESLKPAAKTPPSKPVRKESKEETPEPTKPSPALEKPQKLESKEKVPVKKEKPVKVETKSVVAEKDVTSKEEQLVKCETPEKQGTDVKLKASKEKSVKKEVKAKPEEKKEEKEKPKKEVSKKEEKTPIKKEEKPKKEEIKQEVKKEVKKEEKKETKKEVKKEAPPKEVKKEGKKEEKKEIKKEEKEAKKDIKKVPKETKTAAPLTEVKKPAAKSKPQKKEEPAKKEAVPSGKPKEKGRIKTVKKEIKVSGAQAALAAVGATPTTVAAAEITASGKELEVERSLMSSPEDLTKDFEELKDEEIETIKETKPQVALIEDELKLTGTEQKEAFEVHKEKLDNEGPAESSDEGITTTEAEGECEQTPEELEPVEKHRVDDNEKFEDEGTGLEESSEAGDYEEKAETEEAEERGEDEEAKTPLDTTKTYIEEGRKIEESSEEITAEADTNIKDEKYIEKADYEASDERAEEDREEAIEKAETEETEEEEDKAEDIRDEEETEKIEAEEDYVMAVVDKAAEAGEVEDKYGLLIITPTKRSEPQSPAVELASSIHDERLPGGSESEATVSDEENREDQPEEFTATSGYTQSTIEISSEPTPMDEMSTPRDVMSDETNNEESESPSQEYVNITKYETSLYSQEFGRPKLSPLPDAFNGLSEGSKTEATEGKDYNASASTISPPSSLEEDKFCKSAFQDVYRQKESEIQGTTTLEIKETNQEGVAGKCSPAKSPADSLSPPSPVAKTPLSERNSPSAITETVSASHTPSLSLQMSSVKAFGYQESLTKHSPEPLLSPEKEDSEKSSRSPEELSYSYEATEKTTRSPEDISYSYEAAGKSTRSPQTTDYSYETTGKTTRSPEATDYSYEIIAKNMRSSEATDYSYEMTGKTTRSPGAMDYSYETTGKATRSPGATDYSYETTGKTTKSPEATDYSYEIIGKTTKSPEASDYSYDRIAKATRSPDTTDYSYETTGRTTRSPEAMVYSCETTGKASSSPEATDYSFETTGRASRSPEATGYSYEASAYFTPGKSLAESRQDVDLCLVSSCEYKHPKTELSPSFINPNPLEWFASEEQSQDQEKLLTQSGGAQPPSGGKQQGRQCDETPPTSVSESAPSQTDSDVPPETEECPSITADANIDSEDESETIPTDKTITYKHIDPPPVPLQDHSPSPRHPDVSMVDPEALPVDQNLGKPLKKDLKEKAKTKKQGTKTKSSSPVKKSDGKSKQVASPKPSVKESLDKISKTASPKKESVEKATKSISNPEVKSQVEEKDKDTKNAANTTTSKSAKTATIGPGNTKAVKATAVPPGPPVYLDLVYIPNHSNSKNVDVEFFKRVRSSYYVVSGNDSAADEPSRAVLDSLLEGKAQWESNMQV